VPATNASRPTKSSKDVDFSVVLCKKNKQRTFM